jgi:hypothetical protein
MKHLIIITIILFSACSRWIAPPYTNVDKLSEVQIGMNLASVNDVLGIEPYDIYFKGDNSFIVIYNYRVKDRNMTLSGNAGNSVHSEFSQTAGSEWYGESYFSYIYFQDGFIKSIVTDRGKIKSEDILVKNNNIYLIQKDRLGYYMQNDSIVFVPYR